MEVYFPVTVKYSMPDKTGTVGHLPLRDRRTSRAFRPVEALEAPFSLAACVRSFGHPAS